MAVVDIIYISLLCLWLCVSTCDGTAFVADLYVNDASGVNGGSCLSNSTACKDLSYVISYVNSYQSTSNNISIYIETDYNDTYQVWNNTLSVYEQSSSIQSKYIISGEDASITTIGWHQSSQTTGSSIYNYYQYGADFELSDFRLVNDDSYYYRYFVYSYFPYYSNQFLFRNIHFDSLTLYTHFFYEYSSSSTSYGRSLITFEDCVFDNLYESTYFLYTYYGGGLNMDNVLFNHAYFSSYGWYSRYRRGLTSSTFYYMDNYIKNLYFNDTYAGSYFLYDYYAYVAGNWTFDNLYFDGWRGNSYFAYLYYGGYGRNLYANNITFADNYNVGSYFYGYLFYTYYYFEISITNVEIQDLSYMSRLAYIYYSYGNQTLLENVTYKNVQGASNIFSVGYSSCDVVIKNIYAENGYFSYLFELWDVQGGTTRLENITMKDVSIYNYQSVFYSDVYSRYNWSTGEYGNTQYDSKGLYLNNWNIINANNGYWGFIVFRTSDYLEINNYNIESDKGLGYNNSYTAGMYMMDWAHIGELEATNINFKDTIISYTAHTQYGFKKTNVKGITLDNVHADTEWALIEFYNIGTWDNDVSDVYVNGHYLADNLAGFSDSYYGCNGYENCFDTEAILYFYYDGDAAEGSGGEGGLARRRRSRRLLEDNDDDLLDEKRMSDEDLRDELMKMLDDNENEELMSIHDARRKLLYFYYYYDVYESNYSMTCDDYYDRYYNFEIIDNAVNGPVVMVDIDVNDCPIIFDNWLIEENTNLAGTRWRSKNMEDKYGGEDYLLNYYEYYYGSKYDYPSVISGKMPPGLFFVYQYHRDNVGILHIKNSVFENNYNFTIVSCGEYSFCNVVFENCTFENNYLTINGENLLNPIYMEDGSYGNVTIIDSTFIGDYASQDGGIQASLLLNETKNSTYNCINCRYVSTGAPTQTPTPPSQAPTNAPTLTPTGMPTQTPVIDRGISVAIHGSISSQLTSAIAENIIQNATELILDAEDYLYAEVIVEATEITTVKVESNIYVYDTDITTEELIELVDSNLEDAIDEIDGNNYFSSMTSLAASTSISQVTEDSGSDSFDWELLVIIVACILGAVILCGLYDYYCVNKVAHETPVKLNSSFHATPGGGYGTNASGKTTGGGSSTTELHTIKRINSQSGSAASIKFKANGDGKGNALLDKHDTVANLPDLPDQPQVDDDLLAVGTAAAAPYTTNGADELAEEALEEDVPAVTKGNDAANPITPNDDGNTAPSAGEA